MSRALEESRTQLLRQAAELAERQGGAGRHDGRLDRFLDRYYRHVATEDLLARQPEDVLGAALSHRALAQTAPDRDGERAGVHAQRGRARLVAPATRSWRSSPTTCRSSSTRSPRRWTRSSARCTSLVHPQLAVRRDATGALLEILDVDPGLTGRAAAGRGRRVLDAPGDRPREQPGRGGPAHGPRRVGAGRRPRRRRGLAVDVPRRDRRSPPSLAEQPAGVGGPLRGRRTRTTCWSGWRTGTSRSSATASTPWSARTTGMRCSRSPGRGWASCATTGRWPAASPGSRPARRRGPANRTSSS